MQTNFKMIVGLMGILLIMLLPLHANALPSWAKLPNSDNAQELWGMGSGDDLETARKNALADIAAKFNAEVQESIRSYYRQHNEKVSETFIQETQVNVQATMLSHFEMTQTDESNGQIWAEVRLDRRAFANSLKQNWSHQNTKLKDKFATLTSLSSLEQFVGAQELEPSIAQLEVLSLQLKFADPSVDIAPSLAFYQVSAKRIDEIKSQQSVIVVNNDAPERFQNLIMEMLSTAGLKVTTRDATSRADDKSEIHLRATSHAEQDKRQAYIFRITLEITSQTPAGDVIGKASHLAKGRSYESADDALNKAVSSMSINLKKQSIRKLLKLESSSV